MIKNEKQYKIAKAKLAKWVSNQTVHEQLVAEATTPTWILNEQRLAINEEIKQLEDEIKEYEDVFNGGVELPDPSLVDSIPALLIKWRIARKMTQKQLASLSGINENLLQKYESENYSGASYSTIAHIAHVLRDDLNSSKSV
jgi:hypothetical protein